MATAAEVVAAANDLAHQFYALAGYTVRKGYRFDRATHPQERLMWRLAAAAFEALRDTSPDDCLAELEDGE